MTESKTIAEQMHATLVGALAPTKQDTREDVDLETKVLGACTRQLAQLPPEAATRVLLYLTRRFAEPPLREDT